MIPTLSQVCSLRSPFETDIADYAAGKCPSVEIWLTKLESYLQDHSLDDVRRLLDEHQVQVPAASFQGGLLTSQGDQRRAAWQLFQRRLQLCSELKIGTLVVAADIQAPLAQTDLDRAIASLSEIAQAAEKKRVRVALEFQAAAAFANNLQTAASLVNDVGSASLGLCLDVFQLAIGPSKWSDLNYLSLDNLFHVQVCDLADVARELATDADRILPGEGDLPLSTLIDCLTDLRYAGAVSVELLNPQIWQVPALQFGEIACTSLRNLLKPSVP